MTARLPVVGSDNNAWGTLLNAFLAVGHNVDGSLIFIIPYNVQLQATDSGAVTAPILKIDASGRTIIQQHPTGQDFLFQDKNGNTIFELDSSGHPIVNNNTSFRGKDNGGTQRSLFRIGPTNNTEMLLGPSGKFIIENDNTGNVVATFLENSGMNLQAEDSSGVNALILGVNSSGYTFVQAHSTGKIVNIQDSSGNAIASFAETNKIATFKGGNIVNRTAVSANYTILASDYIVAYTSTSSAFTATLPAAAAGNAGQEWIVKDESGAAATNNITVKTNGGTIDGVAAGTGKVINTNFGVLRVYSNGTNYFTF